VAVFGGPVVNLGFHWKNLPLPVWLVLLYAPLAAEVLVVLAISAWAASLGLTGRRCAVNDDPAGRLIADR
jgi:hypothetical protein